MVVKRKVIEDFIHRAYDTACSHGFHDVEHTDIHYLMLVLSDICEMVVADCKNRRANRAGFEKCVGLTWNDRFKDYVKDSLEDELADVVIRLCDFCGLRGLIPLMSNEGVIEMREEFESIFGDMSVCEQCFSLSCLVMDLARKEKKERNLGMILSFCFEFARHHGIDLAWNVEQKLRYNETRPHKNGKKY